MPNSTGVSASNGGVMPRGCHWLAFVYEGCANQLHSTTVIGYYILMSPSFLKISINTRWRDYCFLDYGLGLLNSLEGLRTLLSAIGTRVWTIVKLSLRVAGRKFCLRSRRTLSLRDPAFEGIGACDSAKNSNNVVGKLGVGKLFYCFIKDKAWRLFMRFQSLVKPNWILKITFGLWISWESGMKAAFSILQWKMNFSFKSQGDPIFRTTESGHWFQMRFQTKSIIVNWSKVLNVFLSSSLHGRWCEW